MFLLSFQAKGIALKNTKSCFPARLACCDLRPSGSRKSRGAGGLACGESPTRSTRASSMQSRSGSRLALGSAPGFFLGRPTGRFFSAAAGSAAGAAAADSAPVASFSLFFLRASFSCSCRLLGIRANQLVKQSMSFAVKGCRGLGAALTSSLLSESAGASMASLGSFEGLPRPEARRGHQR